jgi:hypothetical protein
MKLLIELSARLDPIHTALSDQSGQSVMRVIANLTRHGRVLIVDRLELRKHIGP